jgi:hypothetical protein
MPSTPAQRQNFVKEFITTINSILDGRERAKMLRERAVATGLVAELTSDDFQNPAIQHIGDATALTDAFRVMDTLESQFTDYSVTPPVPKPDLSALLKFRP